MSADYERPFETKDLATAMSAVAVTCAVTGPLRDVVSGVHALKSRFSGTRVEGLPAEGCSSVSEPIAEVDQLLADVTSSTERSEQRARILERVVALDQLAFSSAKKQGEPG